MALSLKLKAVHSKDACSLMLWFVVCDSLVFMCHLITLLNHQFNIRSKIYLIHFDDTPYTKTDRIPGCVFCNSSPGESSTASCVGVLPAGSSGSARLPARQPAAAEPGEADEASTSTPTLFCGAWEDSRGAPSAGCSHTGSHQHRPSGAAQPPVSNTSRYT